MADLPDPFATAERAIRATGATLAMLLVACLAPSSHASTPGPEPLAAGTRLAGSPFVRHAFSVCPARDLLESNATPLIAFGTDDEQVDANGMEAIVAEFLAANRPVVVKRIHGGSHVLGTPDTAPFENLVGVFAEAITWMAGESASPQAPGPGPARALGLKQQ
jgi:hypothetical protein